MAEAGFKSFVWNIRNLFSSAPCPSCVCLTPHLALPRVSHNPLDHMTGAGVLFILELLMGTKPVTDHPPVPSRQHFRSSGSSSRRSLIKPMSSRSYCSLRPQISLSLFCSKLISSCLSCTPFPGWHLAPAVGIISCCCWVLVIHRSTSDSYSQQCVYF